MSNPFLNGDHAEIETAILLEQATQCNLGLLSPAYKNAVAFTNGIQVFINDDDSLAKILPAYDHNMLKWLLWHEEYHKQLKHHNRFFKYLYDLSISDCEDKFNLTKDEVNIIMDILVHDSLSKMFPELVPTAIANLAQMRNRNSLEYTFKTFNLEDMLNEYKAHKEGKTSDDRESKSTEDTEDTENVDKKSKSAKKSHGSGGSGKSEPKSEDPTSSKSKSEDPESEHDKTDWSKLEKINTKEFINNSESEYLNEKIETLKRKKFKLAKLTETLNGLATTTKARTYTVPSYMNTSKNIIMKGKRQGKALLYLVFDASGSMGEELETFKNIISKSIPHAMNVPCEWFAGENHNASVHPYKIEHGGNYYKGTFKDIMKTYATSGFGDDGDRTIALCLKAEELGYSPIGVTDGGGGIYHPEVLKQLKRTIFVGPNGDWLKHVKEINPRIQYIDIKM